MARGAGGSLGLRLIAAILALDTLAFAAYYTASRAYVRDFLGEVEAYRYVAVLVAAETVPVLLAVALGVLGEAFRGRRLVAAVSVLRALFYPLVVFVDPKLIVIPVFLGSVFGYLFYINALGALLESVRGSARTYAVVTLVFPIFWSIGSLVPGVLEPIGGYTIVFAFVGLLGGLASALLALASRPGDSGAPGYSSVVASLKLLKPRLIIVLLAAGAGLNLFWNIMSIKLYETSGSLLLFGLIGGTLTTILSTVARPVAGVLADKVEPIKMLAAVYATYTVYGLLMYRLEGMPFIILWLIPIYPFREVAQTMTISRSLPKEYQVTAASIITLTYSLPSITYPILYFVGVSVAEAAAIYVATLTLSTIVLVTVRGAQG
ncbi:MAG: MFS transporter [Thermoprotei archaeon]|nr:MFS transporter [Thermoprotei archaeon]